MLLPGFLATLAVLTAATPLHNEARQGSAQQQMQQIINNYNMVMNRTLGGQCNAGNVRIRREWGDLSPADRRRYIAAVKCTGRQPAQTPRSYAPGVRNRHDDFDVTHITQWQNFHNSPMLLAWHRGMVAQMEDALIECGWDQGQPYWNYAKWAQVPWQENPLFDGSDTSLSGDGSPHRDPQNGTVISDDCNCVTSGPFADWTVNIGPLNALCQNNPAPNGLAYNPRCITRKINPSVQQYLTYDVLVRTITQHTDFTDFAVHLESSPEGFHPNPHTFIGGMQTDIPGSSSDHAFYFHHCGLDWLWALWQALDLENRVNVVANTEAFREYREGRSPPWPMIPQPNLDTVMNYSPSFESLTIREVMSTTSGRYCYIYQ